MTQGSRNDAESDTRTHELQHIITKVAAVSTDAYETLRTHAAVIDRTDRGLIAVDGTDRGEYLQGQLTNDVAALPDGGYCYAAHLTPQGRLIADMHVYHVDGRLLLDVPRDEKDALVAKFQELIFTEEVEISDWSRDWVPVGVVGPAAHACLSEALGRMGVEGLVPDTDESARPLVTQHTASCGRIIVAHTDSLGMAGYDLWVEPGATADLRDALVKTGCVVADDATAETVRVENGRPRFLVDMDQTTIPLEAGLEDRAIDFDKGCYVGQEVIIRIMHRGQGRVARRLVGLVLEGDEQDTASVAGASLAQGDDERGRVTSVAWSPRLGQVVALGYVAREQTEPGTKLELVTADARRVATVTSLPFVRG